MNLLAWIVGLVLCGLIARGGRSLGAFWVALGVLGLGATILSPPLEGVHRWIGLGPVRLNAAELLMPAAMVGVATLRMPTWVSVLVLALFIQPDASQAVAVACASIAILVIRKTTWTTVAVVSLPAAALAVAAVLQPDRLSPVPEVEGIIGLANRVSPLLAALAVMALAGTVLIPLLLTRTPSRLVRSAAIGLTIYLSLSAIAPIFGAFPVPLVGMGMSPILGWWLGFGALAGLARIESEAGDGS
ncbi:hypothetical protein [Pinirhizobacter soli]|uniref:hypothetical protein n=1 Tax=Pinirhizobacter soli TaxID=2786953 RepID=UPI00202A885D|nr:hypothetical protein [Pinirhizobacter soli]